MNYPNSVLLIDDDLEDCEILSSALKECCNGMKCYYEQDAETAIKRLYDSTLPIPDMVFLDWRMPLVSGADILSIIRKLPYYKEIPVVIFTGGYAGYWEEAQKLGASYLLIKPSVMEDLITQLQQIFEMESRRNLG